MIFQKASKDHLLQSSIGCNGRSRNLAILMFETKTFERNFSHGLLIIYLRNPIGTTEADWCLMK